MKPREGEALAAPGASHCYSSVAAFEYTTRALLTRRAPGAPFVCEGPLSNLMVLSGQAKLTVERPYGTNVTVSVRESASTFALGLVQGPGINPMSTRG